MLEKLIENYQPNRNKVNDLTEAKIALLVGISGAGKDTIKRALLQTDDFYNLISHTTRQPRVNNGVLEQDGIEYYFIDQPEAITMLQKGEFIEAKVYSGNVYGTSFSGISAALEAGQVAINDVEVQGVDEYKMLLPQTKAIFILPPDFTQWRERLSKRYQTTEEFTEQWPSRRDTAIAELRHALKVPYYHFVINDNLDQAVRVIREIALGADTFNRKDDEARLLARDILESIEKHS